MRCQKIILLTVALLLSSCGFQLQTATTTKLPFKRLRLLSDHTSLLFDTQLTKQLRTYNTVIETHSKPGTYLLKLTNYRIFYDQPTFSTSNQVFPTTFRAQVDYQLLKPSSEPLTPIKKLVLTKYQMTRGDQLYLSLPKYINIHAINRELTSRLIKQLQLTSMEDTLTDKS